MYAMGQNIELYMDTLPAKIEPLPAGVPVGFQYRIVCTEEMITVLWMAVGSVGRVDVPMTKEEMSTMSFRGGQAGQYLVSPAGGCGCGMGLLKGFRPFPDQNYVQTARSTPENSQPYGVPPQRWSRING